MVEVNLIPRDKVARGAYIVIVRNPKTKRTVALLDEESRVRSWQTREEAQKVAGEVQGDVMEVL